MSEDVELIKCVICGQKFKRVTNTHLRNHKMTMKEYKQKYPNAPIDMKGLAKKRVDHLRNRTYKDQKMP